MHAHKPSGLAVKTESVAPELGSKIKAAGPQKTTAFKVFLKRALMGLVVLILLALAWVPVSVLAAEQTAAATEQVSIEVADSKAQDKQISQRIQGIYTELNELNSVTVRVKGGVVTLSGEVANAADAERAAQIANRVTGVVTVVDKIERTLSVQENISPALQSLQDLSEDLLRALPLFLLSLLAAGLITLLGWFVSHAKLIQRLSPNPFIAELVSQLILIVSVVVALITMFSLMGAATLLGTLLGGAGVIGIAVGFAVKDSIENYVASIMLSLRQPFRAGDHVVIDDKEGIVIRLTTRATILMTLDGNHLRIPNAQVFKGLILNYTTNPERRLEFQLGVDAEDDPIAAMETGLVCLNQLEFVLGSPAAEALVVNVGDSNIVLEFHAWIDQTHTDFLKARSLCIAAVKNVLEDGGFSLPEPIYRVRLDASSGQNLEAALLGSQPKPALSANQGVQAEEAEAESKPKTKTGLKSGAKPKNTAQPVSLTKPAKGSVTDVSADTELKAKVEQEKRSDDNLLSEQAQTE